MSYLYYESFIIVELCKGGNIMNNNFNKQELKNGKGEQNINIINQKQDDDNFENLESLPKLMLQWIDVISNDMIVVANQAGNVLFISKSVESVLGYEVSDII